MYVIFVHICCRAPRGARGLKLSIRTQGIMYQMSRPARGAWIEIEPCYTAYAALQVAPREGRVD